MQASFYEKALTDRRPEEHVVAVVRHHWWVLFRDTIGIIILFLLPFFLVPFIVAMVASGGPVAFTVPGGFGLFFASLWALMLWHLLFMRWTDFYFDMWIVTNLRVVDIDQRGFFHRDVATLLDLDHIQDITTKTIGIIGNILNFGTLTLQTSGAKIEFIIDEVPHPQKVERMIRDAQLAHGKGTLHSGTES